MRAIRICWAVLVGCPLVTARPIDESLLCNWTDLEVSVGRGLPEVVPLSLTALQTNLKQNAEFTRWADIASVEALIEATRSQLPWLSVAATVTLSERRPDLGWRCAMRLFVRHRMSAAVTGDVLFEIIRGAPGPHEEILDELAGVLQDLDPVEASGQAALLLTLLERTLGTQTIDKWYHRNGRTPLPATWDALIVDMLVRQRRRAGDPLSETLQEHLDSYAHVPGWPQCVFAIHASSGDPRLDPVLRCMLSGESPLKDDHAYRAYLMRIVRKYADQVGEIDLSELGTPSDLRREIAEQLKRD